MRRRGSARARIGRAGLLLLGIALALPSTGAAQRWRRAPRDTTPTLGLKHGYLNFDAGGFHLKLVRASQTVAALQPKGADGFDFTPGDRLKERDANGFFHLGDLTLRLRSNPSDEWTSYSTAAARHPVKPLHAAAPVLAAADLSPTLPADIPLQVRRYWEMEDGSLALRFDVRNRSDHTVEIGALGIPMVFDNILTKRSLEEAHAKASFTDPYIGDDAGYVQVTRLNGHGPTLVVVPLEKGHTPLEAYRPLLHDPTPRGTTFEGFYEWMPLSEAYAENEWKNARPWNAPTFALLAPGETRSYGVRFLVADSIQDIEETLHAHDRPVAVGVPGYVLPTDQEAKLFLRYDQPVRSMSVDGPADLEITPGETTPHGWRTYHVRGSGWGRARLTITYADGLRQTVQYKVIKPEHHVVADLGHFLTTEQWFEKPDDPFGRSPSVISYDNETKQQVTEENRAWIAGLSDEGGAGSWLAAVMKQLVEPDSAEIAKLQRFVDGVLWGKLQYSEGEHPYGVRKSLFYYAPDSLPAGTYSDSIHYGGWSSWSRKEAESIGRSYNYPHVAAAYWVLYRLARYHQGLVTDHPADWYLDHAYRTSMAMVKYAPYYAQFGQMEGTVFLRILEDLQREGWTEQATALAAVMHKRADVWDSLAFPFGSEMPWDSTGQEEVYAWTDYFGYADKAKVTLDAILGYMPTVPNWGYNGSARRYWDFNYAGKLRRTERQLHHYGSGLNAIPVLSAFRENPSDFYLLRVGFGGLMGSIANVTQEGFGPSAFHAFPSTLKIDGYSGDYGPNFFGHAVNTGTYVVHHPEFGWLAFGGNLQEANGQVRVEPRDAYRARVYLAPLGLWLTLDAGQFQSVSLDPATGAVRLELAPADSHTPAAFLRIEQPAKVAGVGEYAPRQSYSVVRGAYQIPLGAQPTVVELSTSR